MIGSLKDDPQSPEEHEQLKSGDFGDPTCLTLISVETVYIKLWKAEIAEDVS